MLEDIFECNVVESNSIWKKIGCTCRLFIQICNLYCKYSRVADYLHLESNPLESG
jgi:hypothetical protein